MATYVSLLRYTDQGIRSIKESPGRLDATKKAFQSMGVELRQFFLVMGEYDIMLVTDAPNAETVARCALSIASQGNVRSETFRVFSESEYKKIIAGLP